MQIDEIEAIEIDLTLLKAPFWDLFCKIDALGFEPAALFIALLLTSYSLTRRFCSKCAKLQSLGFSNPLTIFDFQDSIIPDTMQK